jgi:hypothetical protein
MRKKFGLADILAEYYPNASAKIPKENLKEVDGILARFRY